MRCFIVGNGPSLRDTPLDDLVGEVSYATNRIHLIYPETKWRPTHYVRVESMQDTDDDSVDLWATDLLVHLNDPNITVHCNMWFPKLLERRGYGTWKNIQILKTCAHYFVHFDTDRCPHLWHLPHLCSFGGSLTLAIQIAVKAGFDKIYLVGCDLGYKDQEESHFIDGYASGYEIDEARYANMDKVAAHMIAMRSSPVRIYNATIGGDLEVYPRVDLAEVLKEKDASLRAR